MDTTSILFIIGAYIFIIFIGMFIVPAVFSERAILKLTKRINSFETGRRDNAFYFLIHPLVRFGVHPNVITIIGFALVFALQAAFSWGVSAVMLFVIALLAGLSDMFDGILARASGKVTSLGGMLDGLRDFLLLIVLTVGGMYGGFFPVQETVWFLVGAIMIGPLKLIETIERGRKLGFKNAFKKRAAGEGKLSIDRIKFFFYIAACLGLILGQTAPWLSAVGYSSLILSIVFAIGSIIFHSANIHFAHERQKA
jgi:cardiolipin synthase